MVINGVTYTANSTTIYDVSKHHSTALAALIDRGANGGVAGEDVRLIARHHRTVHVHGIDNHELTDIPIDTVGGVVPSQHGPVIAILHQYAFMGRGHTIHSAGQLEWFSNEVNDKSVKV